MKAIDRIKNLYVPEVNPEVKQITFRHAAAGVKLKRKGYALIVTSASGQNRTEVLTIEPKEYSNGDRWFVYGSYVNYFMNMNTFYAKNLKEVCKRLEKQK